MFFPLQRPPIRIHPFLSPELRQSVVGLRCDQAACVLGIGRSWPNAASSLGAGRSSACGPPGLRWGLGFYGTVFGRICGTWASAGRSFAFVSHKGGLTVTMGRGWDEVLARTGAFKGWCELGSASSCVSGLRSEVNSHLSGTEEPKCCFSPVMGLLLWS